MVAGVAAIGALASPARQEIIDTVEALGGAAAIAEIAAQLGRPADGLYYHVRHLVRAGLLVEADAGGAVRYRTPAPRGVKLALDYAPGDARSAAAVKRVVASMLRIAKRDFDAALVTPGVVASGPRRALWAGRGKGWVSAADLAEINDLFKRITSVLRRPRRRGAEQLVSVCYVLAPIAIKPARRATAARGSRSASRTSRAATRRPRPRRA